MKVFIERYRGACANAILLFAGVGGVACLFAGRTEAQDTSLKPTFGSISLKGGAIAAKPFELELVAGGEIKTNLGCVCAYVADAPDFKFEYTAADNISLIIRVNSDEDTTLLINLPDGTWVADDDSDGNLNPKLVFARPQSGSYAIYVGTFGKDTAPATLIIEEVQQVARIAPKDMPKNPPGASLVIPAIEELPGPMLPKLRKVEAP